jgi:hypothetical protein
MWLWLKDRLEQLICVSSMSQTEAIITLTPNQNLRVFTTEKFAMAIQERFDRTTLATTPHGDAISEAASSAYKPGSRIQRVADEVSPIVPPLPIGPSESTEPAKALSPRGSGRWTQEEWEEMMGPAVVSPWNIKI